MNLKFLILSLIHLDKVFVGARHALPFVVRSFVTYRLVLLTFTLLYFRTSFLFADPPKPASVAERSAFNVTVIPNPARGKKLTFRVMSAGPCKVRIKIYNRFFDPVAKLEQEGEHLFDILWSLKNIPEGPYLYQVLVDDKTTGETTKLPQQKFWVMKDVTLTPSPKNAKTKSPKN